MSFYFRRTLLEQELETERQGALVLYGQRRMGKSSLLKMLPTHLGSLSTVVICDFHELSGHPLAHAPHRIVVNAVADALANHARLDLSAALQSTDTVGDGWNSARDWLCKLNQALERADHHVLVAIDEVEGLQRSTRMGKSDLSFLDFVRAAGDVLQRIRLVLVTGHLLSSPRLGRDWSSALISTREARLGLFQPGEAESLLRKPVPDFPDEVFADDAVVRAILEQTGTHPYLVQLMGSEVVKRLRRERRRTATQGDVRRALESALDIADTRLFTDLWHDFGADACALMRALAAGEHVPNDRDLVRQLRRQSFLDLDPDGAPMLTFPLFGRWILEQRTP